MNPYVNALIDKLNSSCHVAIKRCIFRLFQRTSFTEEQAGKVVEIGFIHLQDHSYSIAVRVFAMTTLYQITKTYRPTRRARPAADGGGGTTLTKNARYEAD